MPPYTADEDTDDAGIVWFDVHATRFSAER